MTDVMASTSKEGKPVRGILKTSKADDHSHIKMKEAARFDEMNILATYHPPDKDYGHMKIDEPKTPYRSDGEDELETIDPDELANRLTTAENKPNRTRTLSTDEEDDEFLTPQAREKKDKFQKARKQHYNMKEEIKRAKELLAKEMVENDDD